MSESLELSAYSVRGSGIAFSVVVPNSIIVDDLKKVLLKERPGDFPGVKSPSRLTLRKVSLKLDDSLQENAVKAVGEVAVMEPVYAELSTYFSESPPKALVSIVATYNDLVGTAPYASTATRDDSMRKHKADVHSSLAPNDERMWHVSGAIRPRDVPRSYYVDPMKHSDMLHCLELVGERRCILLTGAHGSGKSTRLFCLKEVLSKKYVCLWMSFGPLEMTGTTSQFWKSMGATLKRAASGSKLEGLIKPMSSSEEFVSNLSTHNLHDLRVVLLFDSLGELLCLANDLVTAEFLGACKAIKETDHSAVQSTIFAGITSVMQLTSSYPSLSPFDIKSTILVSYFSLEQCNYLFQEYARDNMLTVPDEIIKDVWALSNGHPGMVCRCGLIIHTSLTEILSNDSRTLCYSRWKRYSLSRLQGQILNDATFRRLSNRELLDSTDQTIAAVSLLRENFLGYLGGVTITSSEEEELADALTTAGVLLKTIGTKTYRMASALIDSIIRDRVLPQAFAFTPPSYMPPLWRKVDVFPVLIESVKMFDKELIHNSSSQSYKPSLVIVNGCTGGQVARESVYETELTRILVYWLAFKLDFRVSTQWCLRDDNSENKDSYIVIASGEYTAVLGLLVNGDKGLVKDCIQRIPKYRELLSANEAWVVHFTCEDSYQPIWPDDDELNKGLNMIHFCHDVEFSRVFYSARWVTVDDTMSSRDMQSL